MGNIASNIVTKIRLRKGDLVVVRSGKYKGLSGKILAVHPRANTVTVDGINVIKKHLKPNRQNPSGGIIDITKPIAVSKVGIAVPGTEKKPKASRIGYLMQKDGKKARVFKTTGKEIKA